MPERPQLILRPSSESQLAGDAAGEAAGAGVGWASAAGTAAGDAAGDALAWGIGAFRSDSWIDVFAPALFAVRIDSSSVIPKNATASHVVNLTSTFVVWAPKRFSVIPPPNAAPRPSLRGRCIRTTKTISTHTRCRHHSKLVKYD